MNTMNISTTYVPPIRFQESDGGEVAPSSHVFKQTCTQIAEALTTKGFSYTKRDRCLTRIVQEFTNQIYFSTSHYNLSGVHVYLKLAAHVSSLTLKVWRQQQADPYLDGEWVVGGLAHLFTPKGTFFQWDVADPQKRKHTISEIIGYIEEIILPFFAQFQVPVQLIERLQTEDLSMLRCVSSIGSLIEFALCFGNKIQAEKILSRIIQGREYLNPEEIKSCITQFQEHGLPPHRPASYVEQIAWVCTVYNLQPSYYPKM